MTTTEKQTEMRKRNIEERKREREGDRRKIKLKIENQRRESEREDEVIYSEATKVRKWVTILFCSIALYLFS